MSASSDPAESEKSLETGITSADVAAKEEITNVDIADPDIAEPDISGKKITSDIASDSVSSDNLDKAAKDILRIEPLKQPSVKTASEKKDEVPVKECVYPLPDDNIAFLEPAFDNVIKCISEGDLSRAYILLKYLNVNYSDSASIFPSWIIESLIYSRNLYSDSDSFSASLTKFYDFFSDEFCKTSSDEWNIFIKILFASAALKPSLIAPSTKFHNILEYVNFSDRFVRLNDFFYKIKEYSYLNIPLTYEVKCSVQDKKDKKSSYEILKHEILEWKERTLSTRFNFIPASNLLKKWLSEDGFISSILNPVLRNETKRVKEVKDKISVIDNNNDCYKIINKDIKSFISGGDTVAGYARDLLVGKLMNAKRFAEMWIDITKLTESERNFVKETISEIYTYWHLNYNDIVKFIDKTIETEKSYLLTAALVCLKKSFDNLKRYYDGKFLPVEINLPVEDYLYKDSWSVVSGNIVYSAYSDFNQIDFYKDNLKLFYDQLSAVDKPVNWNAVYNAQCEAGNFFIADKIKEYFSIYPYGFPENISAWENKRRTLHKNHTDKFNKLFNDTVYKVENYVIDSILNESEREHYLSELNAVKTISDMSFKHAYERISDLKKELELKYEEHKNIFREKVQLLENISEDRKNLILEKINQNELASAHLLYNAAERGENVVLSMEKNNYFGQFYDNFDSIEKALIEFEKNSDSFIEQLENLDKSFKIGPLNMPSDELNLNVASDILSGWFKYKREFDSLNEGFVNTLFNNIGWSVNAVVMPPKQPEIWNCKSFVIDFKTIPYCPVPHYGSDSNLQYQVFVVKEKPDISVVIKLVENCKNKSIVLYFGRLSKKQRMDLLKSRVKSVFMDDIAVSALACFDGNKLDYFYNILMPFVYLIPYITSASTLPKEMFFGRRRIIESLLDPYGSCILYGGRQLGKTVILKHIEKEFNDPDSGRFVVYNDIKNIGEFENNPAAIWSKLSEYLLKIKIISKKSQVKDYKSALTVIKKWLEESKDRRILFMLDEADKFIELDYEERKLENINSLIDLMTETNNRFKFILSGLHSVNRFSKISNAKISHLLTRRPLCVGPMIGNGEQYEAVRLVEMPLTLLGFRFKSDEVLSRILSICNFYPSLLQLFCYRLLSHIYNDREDISPARPFEIDIDIIENLYNKNNTLRQELKERFEWTLLLDPRYEAIAYSLAEKIILSKNTGLSAGSFTLNDVRDNALSLNKDLFVKTKSLDEFSDILEEMIGLGILRKTRDNKYTFKNHNIINLLIAAHSVSGDRTISSTLEDILYKIMAKKPEEKFTPENNRDEKYDTVLDIKRFSPLVAVQEGTVFSNNNGIYILSGSEALGFNSVPEFIEHSSQNYDFSFIHQECNGISGDFEALVDNFFKNESKNKEILLLNGNFSTSNIAYAFDKFEQKKNKMTVSFKKIIFLISASEYYNLLIQENEFVKDIFKKGMKLIVLRKVSEHFLENKWKLTNMIPLNLAEISTECGYWTGYYERIISDKNFIGNFKALKESLRNKSESLTFFGIVDGVLLKILKSWSSPDILYKLNNVI